MTQSPSNQRPHVITVISNMYRDSREKLILNPNTAQNFEDVLQDLQNMVFIPHPPVRALWTEEKPHIKVSECMMEEFFAWVPVTDLMPLTGSRLHRRQARDLAVRSQQKRHLFTQSSEQITYQFFPRWCLP